MRQFAELGIRGISSQDTVRKYRSAWERAVDRGWARPVEPGEVVALPKEPFRYLAGIVMSGLMASTGVEWYTPGVYVEAAREVMGGIDLDPASCEIANRTVAAPAYFTAEDDGLAREWHGRVWLNPPYGPHLSSAFSTKLLSEYDAGRVTAAVLLLNAMGFDNDWWQPLWRFPVCFTDHRIGFYGPQREARSPAYGNVFIYLGPDPEAFAATFAAFGTVVRVWS